MPLGFEGEARLLLKVLGTFRGVGLTLGAERGCAAGSFLSLARRCWQTGFWFLCARRTWTLFSRLKHQQVDPGRFPSQTVPACRVLAARFGSVAVFAAERIAGLLLAERE